MTRSLIPIPNRTITRCRRRTPTTRPCLAAAAAAGEVAEDALLLADLQLAV